MARIRWTREAYRTLRDIHGYIAADNPDAAKKVIIQIYERVQTLRDFPEVGHKYATVEEGEVRILLYGYYRIAYLLHSRHSVDVLGIFHGALNIDDYLP